MSQTQTQFKQSSKPQAQERELSEVERFLEVRFNDSKIDNAVLLISTIASRFYYTAVMPIDVRDILTAFFYHDESSAEAEVILKNGIVVKARIMMPADKKTVETYFNIASIHRSDCYCGE